MVENSARVLEYAATQEIIVVVSELQIGMVTKIHMPLEINSMDWQFDSGATIHVRNHRKQFKTYKEATKVEGVLMGNENVAKVEGKGTIELQFTSGKKLVILNAFYVPELGKTWYPLIVK